MKAVSWSTVRFFYFLNYCTQPEAFFVLIRINWIDSRACCRLVDWRRNTRTSFDLASVMEVFNPWKPGSGGAWLLGLLVEEVSEIVQ
jgi:hypothetical protein